MWILSFHFYMARLNGWEKSNRASLVLFFPPLTCTVFLLPRIVACLTKFPSCSSILFAFSTSSSHCFFIRADSHWYSLARINIHRLFYDFRDLWSGNSSSLIIFSLFVPLLSFTFTAATLFNVNVDSILEKRSKILETFLHNYRRKFFTRNCISKILSTIKIPREFARIVLTSNQQSISEQNQIALLNELHRVRIQQIHFTVNHDSVRAPEESSFPDKWKSLIPDIVENRSDPVDFLHEKLNWIHVWCCGMTWGSANGGCVFSWKIMKSELFKHQISWF